MPDVTVYTGEDERIRRHNDRADEKHARNLAKLADIADHDYGRPIRYYAIRAGLAGAGAMVSAVLACVAAVYNPVLVAAALLVGWVGLVILVGLTAVCAGYTWQLRQWRRRNGL